MNTTLKKWIKTSATLLSLSIILVSCNWFDDSDDGCTVGEACDDGDPTTNNDIYLQDCSCAGQKSLVGECIVGEPCDDGNTNTANDQGYLVDGVCVCLGDDQGAPPPVPPIDGEISSVYWGGAAVVPVMDIPGIYAMKDGADPTGAFSFIIVAIPHDIGHKFVSAGEPTESGDTLVYTFNSVAGIAKALSVFVFNDVRPVKDFVKVQIGGGGGSSMVATASGDDESPIYNAGVPILWNRHTSPTTVQAGGFVYGLPGNKRPVLADPTGASPAVANVNTTPAAHTELFRYVVQDWPDASGETRDLHKVILTGTPNTNRSTWFWQ